MSRHPLDVAISGVILARSVRVEALAAHRLHAARAARLPGHLETFDAGSVCLPDPFVLRFRVPHRSGYSHTVRLHPLKQKPLEMFG